MSDYDWTDIRATLEKIARGEHAWEGSRKEAHEALVECRDAVMDRSGPDGLPHIGDRPDWRRMPAKASGLLCMLDDSEHGESPNMDTDDLPAPKSAGTMSALALDVLERLLEGGGVTIAQLREVTGKPERDVRASIKEIRARYQSDHGEHPVNWSSRWWLARELSAMGKDLQPTARGTLKVVNPERDRDVSDTPEPKAAYHSKPHAQLVDEVREMLEGHPDTEKVVVEVVSRIDESFAARQNYKDVCGAARKAKERAEVNVKEAVEEGRATGDTVAAEVQLDGIQSAWQAKEEMYAKGIEDRKEARLRKKRAEAALEQLMSNLKQLELPGVS